MAWTNPKTWAALDALTAALFNTEFRDNLNFLKSNVALGNPSELTIDTGAVVKTQSYHTIDTESDASSDELDTINGGTEGELIAIRAVHTDRTVVLTEAGNMILGGSSVTMDNTEVVAILFRTATKWILIGVASIYTDADAKAACVSDVAYAGSWDDVTDVAPSKDAVYEKVETLVDDTIYPTGWDGDTDTAPSRNAVFDKIELHEGTAAAHHAVYLDADAVAAAEAAGLDLADGKAISLVKTLGTDHTASGITVTATAGEILVFGNFCYLKSDGKLWKAKGDAASTMPGFYMALAGIAADADGLFLEIGKVRDDSWSWTVGGILWIDTSTAGALTQTKPTGSGNQIQEAGIAMAATVIDLRPTPKVEAIP